VLAVALAAISHLLAQEKPAAEKTGLKPLSEMGAGDRCQGEDGGLYGGGHNEPPAAHRQAAEAELARMRPLDAFPRMSAAGSDSVPRHAVMRGDRLVKLSVAAV
jgi:hypothetical protein